jgi:hypothetical protein
MYRDYTDQPSSPPAPESRVAPEPGTGTVFVNEVEDGKWCASWQAGSALQDFEGSEPDVLEWARSRPALTHLIFSAEQDDYVPF